MVTAPPGGAVASKVGPGPTPWKGSLGLAFLSPEGRGAAGHFKYQHRYFFALFSQNMNSFSSRLHIILCLEVSSAPAAGHRASASPWGGGEGWDVPGNGP